MKRTVMLSVAGTQRYVGQEPDTIELLTEGQLEYVDGGWNISYEESALTGLSGVHTLFRIQPEEITLTRTGTLRSQMVFRKGVAHDSLYQSEFGTLMITVCATNIFCQIGSDGGVVDLQYTIEIEKTEAGEIDYHLEIRPVEEKV